MVGKGEVLAKASELGPHLTVVFPDDFVGSAQVIATDWTRDLALFGCRRIIPTERVHLIGKRPVMQRSGPWLPP